MNLSCYINITLTPKVLAPDAQLNLTVSITIITDCVCINCTHVPSYYNSSINVKWSSRYRLPNSWVFLRNNKRYQALSPHYRGVCDVECILPALIDHLDISTRDFSEFCHLTVMKTWNFEILSLLQLQLHSSCQFLDLSLECRKRYLSWPVHIAKQQTWLLLYYLNSTKSWENCELQCFRIALLWTVWC